MRTARGSTPVRGALAVASAFTVLMIGLQHDRTGFLFWRDTVAHDLPFLLAALACWTAPTADPARRRGWRLYGTAFACSTVGNVWITLQPGTPLPADACWLTAYVLVGAGLVLLLRGRTGGSRAVLLLDGAIAGTGAAALASTFAVDVALRTAATASTLPTLVAFGYPVADLALVAVLVGAGVVVTRHDVGWWVQLAGLSLYTVTDLGYLWQVGAGTYRPGTWLNIGWPLAVALVGAASRLPEGTRTAELRPRLAIPAGFAVCSVGLLVAGQGRGFPAITVVLAVLALALVAARVGVTLRQLRHPAQAPAGTDPLTGLTDRPALVCRLTDRLAAGTPVSLLLLDVDRFKEVNDSLGHLTGDRLLQDVAGRLRASAPDATVARLGGDEFGIVLDGGPAEAAEQARTVRARLQEPFRLGDLTLPIDVSIGVSSSASAGTAEELLTRADLAMYRAKRRRTGVEVSRTHQDRPDPERMALLSDLHRAVAEGELVLHHQPQVHPDSGRVVGLEALVRWAHPARGLLLPDRFLPLAEQFPVMTAITAAVLRQALADCRSLQDQGRTLRVSVNLSAADLMDDALPGLVAAELAAHGLPAGCLVLELTEDIVMRHQDRALQVLGRLAATGVALSVDDYGTGQSSLSYLRDLPISEIKLDRAFLQGVPADAHNAAIVRSTIGLAHDLGLRIVTEGVETTSAFDWLGRIGCDLVQGRLVAPPLPLDQLRDWLVRDRPPVHRSARPGG